MTKMPTTTTKNMKHKLIAALVGLSFLAGMASGASVAEFTKESLVLGLIRLTEKADKAGMKQEAQQVRELYRKLSRGE